jgi:hypothetical protein
VRKHERISMKVYGPKTGAVLVKLEDIDVGSEQPIEVSVDLTKTNEWEELVFDFTGTLTDTWDRIALFFDFGSDVENYYFFDDIMLLPNDVSSNSAGNGSSSLQIYPNPAYDLINIRMNWSGYTNIEITSLNGHLVYQTITEGNTHQLDLSSFPKGVYFITVKSNDIVTTEKLIKL